MNNALLFQQVDGDPFARQSDITRALHTAYAAKWGMDFEIVQGNLYQDGRHTMWSRVARIRKALEQGYEYVFYLDTDCMIVREDVDLRSALPDGYWLALCLYLEGGPIHLSNGVSFTRNSEEARAFWYEVEATWPGQPALWEEQRAVNRALFREDQIDRTNGLRILGPEWNAWGESVENPIIRAWHGLGAINEVDGQTVRARLMTREILAKIRQAWNQDDRLNR